MIRFFQRTLAVAAAFSLLAAAAFAQHSVARDWNEALLQAIRKDFARPTIHARNLFHTSLAMYDAWAAYDNLAQTFLLGKTVGGFTVPFNGIAAPADLPAARKEAVSYAAYRILKYRFRTSPGATASAARFDSLMLAYGYDTLMTSTDYSTGSAAALGNYIAQSVIDFGMQDGSNEANDYAYTYYHPSNLPLIVSRPGDSTLTDPNRWQPLTLTTFIDQNGNIIPGSTPKFLGPEWGNVTPFALTSTERTVHSREGHDYIVYHDQGPPPMLDTNDVASAGSQLYRWGYSLVSVWSSHLKGADTVLWDISPASIGNNPPLPETFAELPSFYKLAEGGDAGIGHTVNPRTGAPYVPQIVPRGDYTRSLAEFWADGPSSETPPGHWFTILNYVSDHPLFQKRFRGTGPVLDTLEWDVKAYFALGGAVHDAAITAWGMKGWYDNIRPISAIRWMAAQGQCSDSTLAHYSRSGLPLIPGFIELVAPGDSLQGADGVNVGKIKIYAWRGHSYIANPATTYAGVGWILAEEWWPYQRRTFVTPPFAGYVSGHSTYSRAAAELMTLLTGDEYFPGGMGEFFAPHNEFLVFEDGPSVDVTLQWATYRDASDQCSLSRIWGGIHPPIDDMPGRLAGRTIGIEAFLLAEKYFTGQVSAVAQVPPVSAARTVSIFPNPVPSGSAVHVRFEAPAQHADAELYNVLGQRLFTAHFGPIAADQTVSLRTGSLPSGIYILRITEAQNISNHRIFVVR